MGKIKIKIGGTVKYVDETKKGLLEYYANLGWKPQRDEKGVVRIYTDIELKAILPKSKIKTVEQIFKN